MKVYVLSIVVLIVFISCDKGYQVRFANYYTERMDTVKIGSKVEFTDVAPQQTTEYSPIKKGKYGITFISHTRKIFYSNIEIPSSGSGNRTVQIDGITQVSILEE